MIVWIDASWLGSEQRIFGLTLIERHLQALVRVTPKPEIIVIELGATGQEIRLPAELSARLKIEWRRTLVLLPIACVRC